MDVLEDGSVPEIAGKTIAERQLLFAREAGCEAIIAFGGGGSPTAIALRHAAERYGLRYQSITSAHALAGSIGSGDTLLVLQPDLLPEARQGLELIQAEGQRVLILSAGPGVAGGFERIDLDRAWAGVLTIPGNALGRLTALPEDAAPHAALLRIALQQRLPEARLADDLLNDGRWSVIADGEMARLREGTWFRTHLPAAVPTMPSRWLARELIAKAGVWLVQRRGSRFISGTLFGLLTAGGVAAAWLEMPILAFALIALGVPVGEAFLALSRLAVAPFGKIARLPKLRYLSDIALFVTGVLVIDSLAHRTFFPPLVLAASLLLLDRDRLPQPFAPLRDRGVMAGFLALLSTIIAPETSIIAVGACALLANVAVGAIKRG
ncbi:hypothetical protein D6201_03560 [Aurantiacibacter aquimixticola]|uniref:Uncharacterized protein n=1 Tax=Aurantiacibacter aquimixticola TaxID=1958945 RepID=A0A419RRZ8_9SPHN|nr:hypothetical protein D6201_03560 [Aurantiacibacter aquimixticola]